ncbi:MAG TPA: elongation factor P [Gammaproteobacteria bacterium]|jgi:elongation factor P|nr:elongation factor P [Gammaproteobacteria bacterium]
MPKISAFDIRIGSLIEHQGKLWRVLKKNHVKPGKGGAFVQIEMKETSMGTKLNERFRSADKVEKAHVEQRKMQYLYADGSDHVFMDTDSYEQLTIPGENIEDQIGFLLPNTEVQVNFHNESPIGMDLPDNVVLTIADTETVVKGQTAAGGGKPATMETGIRVTVPPFVNIGDKVKINTETGDYVERADQ